MNVQKTKYAHRTPCGRRTGCRCRSLLQEDSHILYAQFCSYFVRVFQNVRTILYVFCTRISKNCTYFVRVFQNTHIGRHAGVELVVDVGVFFSHSRHGVEDQIRKYSCRHRERKETGGRRQTGGGGEGRDGGREGGRGRGCRESVCVCAYVRAKPKGAQAGAGRKEGVRETGERQMMHAYVCLCVLGGGGGGWVGGGGGY